MVKLKTIADLIDYQTDDLTTEFDDSKDIFFKTIDDEYMAILKADDVRSMVLLFSNKSDIPSDFFRLVEIKNNKKHGSDLSCLEHLHYEEFHEGILHGYHESHYQGSNLEFRGFYKNGERDGWWEREYNYENVETSSRECSLNGSNGPYSAFQYVNGINITNLRLLETKNDFKNAAKSENEVDYGNYYLDKQEERLRNTLSKHQVYFDKGISYISPSAYKKITNLENLELKWSDYPLSHPVSNYVSRVCKRHSNILKKACLNVNNFPAKSYSIWGS